MHLYLLRFEHPLTGQEVGVTTYAALMLAGATAAVLVAVAIGKRRDLSPFDLFAATVLAYAGGLIGARLLFLVVHAEQIWTEGGWAAFLAPQGGLIWYGGAVGGALAFIAYCRAYDLPMWRMLDIGVVGAALGQAFGRLGCFTAGCCHGAPAPDGVPSVRFPMESLAPPDVPLHPVQLYEAGALLLLALALAFFVIFRRKAEAGTSALLYLGGYALIRLLTEALRGDDRGPDVLGLSLSQSISSTLLAAVVFVSLRRRAYRRKRGEARKRN